MIDFTALMNQQKDPEQTEEKPKQTPESEKLTPSEQKESKTIKDTSKDKKPVKGKKRAKKETEKTYRYPFQIYSEGQILETEHIFQEKQDYTESQITEAMLNHKHYEFAGEMTYNYLNEDNVLVATAKQYKKG